MSYIAWKQSARYVESQVDHFGVDMWLSILSIGFSSKKKLQLQQHLRYFFHVCIVALILYWILFILIPLGAGIK